MNFKITICIITYNRGKRALENVQNILENIKNNCCVLVLNNGSNNEVEFYQQIEKLAEINKQLFYIKHESNILVHGNFRSCFDYAKSKYIMVLSDEDFVNFHDLESILIKLEKFKNIGACRTSIAPHSDLKTPGNSYIYPEKYFKAGEEALNGFSFVGNYISGIIYNIENIKKTNLLNIFDENILSYTAYPHLYLDLLVSSQFDILMTSKIGVLERKGEHTLIENGTGKVKPTHIGLYGYGERINQFLAFRDGIINAIDQMIFINRDDKVKLFVQLYAKLVQKYYFLIFQANIGNYTNNHMEISALKESFFYVTCSSILYHPLIICYQEFIMNLLVEIYQKYKN